MVIIKRNQGFTLVELVVVVGIIAILASVMLPNYMNSVKETRRANMMAEMIRLGNEVEARKIQVGNYNDIPQMSDFATTFNKSFPKDKPDYNVSISSPLNAKWVITAVPVGDSVKDDGTLTLNAEGIKCRKGICGLQNEWN